MIDHARITNDRSSKNSERLPLAKFVIRHLSFVILLLLPLTSYFLPRAYAQSVGISIAVPDNSALLQLQTTAQGLLLPRLTNAQMLAVTTPATGDLVYNSTYVNYYYYNGTIWTPLVGNGWSLTGNSGTSPSTNFLGTIDAEDLVQKTKAIEHVRFYNGGNVGLTNTNNSAESLIFYEPSGSGTRYTGFKAGVQKADTLGVISPHYIWPLGGDGLPNQALVTDGSGDLSWHTFATFSGSGSELLWKRGSAAGGEYSDSTGSSSTGPYSIAAGYHTTVTGNYEAVFGDSTSGVSGSYGAVNGGSGNSSNGDDDASGGGQDNSAAATASYIGGGSNNATSGNEEVVLGGSGNYFSGTNSTIIGGKNNNTTCNQELLYGSGFTDGTCGSVVFKMGTHTLMGIGTVSPAQAMDVNGNVKFSGSLKPNGTAGSSGKYLLSAGAGSPPTWGTIAIAATNWLLTGTSGSSPATNYIGTGDVQDLAIRTNNAERMRVLAAGQIVIDTSTSTHQLTSVLKTTTTETAAIFGNASGSSTSQSVGCWGTANNTGTSNTGTIATLATGNGNTTAGTTNAALQINQGEFAMGRTIKLASAGTIVEPATAGTAFSQQGPSGVIQLSLKLDLNSTAPTAGVFEDLGDVTINSQFISANSIILAGVVQKISSGFDPYPNNSVYKVDVESRSAGSCVVHIGMIPFVTDASNYHPSDYIRIGYTVINPGR